MGWTKDYFTLSLSLSLALPTFFFISPFSLLSSFFSLYLFLINILFLAGRVGTETGRLPPLCHLCYENLHFVQGFPKKTKNVKRKHCFWKFGAPLSHLRLFRLIFLSFRFLPYVSFPLKHKWFFEVLFKSLMFFRKTIDFHRLSLKSWSFLWKANDLSRFLFKFIIFVWVIQIGISETLNIHQNDPLVTVASKSAFAKKG